MKDNKADVIVLRGCPGSGKSQTAKSLSKLFPKGVRLEVDTIRQMVISVDWKNQLEHIHMLQVSTGLINDFLNLGFKPVIVIDTFSGDKINKFLTDLNSLNPTVQVRVFALYTTDEELRKRLELRNSDEFRDFGICKRLNDDVLKFKYAGEVQIDTTGLNSEQTARKIHSIFQ